MANIDAYIETLTSLKDKFAAITGCYCIDPEEYVNKAENKENAVQWLLWHIPGGGFIAGSELINDIKEELSELSYEVLSNKAKVTDASGKVLTDSNGKVLVSEVEVEE